jgi:hypothetical protein
MVLVGAAIHALAGGTTTTFYACVTSKTGAIKIVSKCARCRAGQHKISWNKAGPQGPVGPAGVVAGYNSVHHGGAITSTQHHGRNLDSAEGQLHVTASVYLAILANEAESTS